MRRFFISMNLKNILFSLDKRAAVLDFKPGFSVNTLIINNVSTFDARVPALGAKSKHSLASEKKEAIVDSFAARQGGDEVFCIVII